MNWTHARALISEVKCEERCQRYVTDTHLFVQFASRTLLITLASQHHATSKDVAKETEGQGEYAGKFTDEFNQSHKELNETLEHS